MILLLHINPRFLLLIVLVLWENNVVSPKDLLRGYNKTWQKDICPAFHRFSVLAPPASQVL